MRLTMDQKRTVTGKLAERYRGCSGRKKRARILTEVQELSGYNRHYAAWLLRNFGKTRPLQGLQGQSVHLVVGRRNPRRPALRPRKYDQAVKKWLLLLWEREGLNKADPAYQKLLQISAATIDRLPKEVRAPASCPWMSRAPSRSIWSAMTGAIPTGISPSRWTRWNYSPAG